MLTLIYVIFAIVCVFLIVTVLLQPGKSGGLGAAFGGGGNTVFGASGGTPVFRRMTTGAAILFMFLSLLIASMSIVTTVTSSGTTKKHGLDFSAPGDVQANENPGGGLAVPEAPAENAPAAPVAP